LTLVLLPPFAELLGGHSDTPARAAAPLGLAVGLGLTLVKVISFIALVLLLGPRVMPWLLRQVARTGSRGLFSLCCLAGCLRYRFCLGPAVWRLLCPGRLFRRSGVERIRSQPQSRGQFSAPARRFRRSIFRFGGNAVRSVDSDHAALDGRGRAAADFVGK